VVERVRAVTFHDWLSHYYRIYPSSFQQKAPLQLDFRLKPQYRSGIVSYLLRRSLVMVVEAGRYNMRLYVLLLTVYTVPS